MTREEFIAAHLDRELADGLRAHAEAVALTGPRLSDAAHVELGKVTAAVMRRAREKLGAYYDSLRPAQAEPAKPATLPMNGQPQRKQA